MRKRWTVLVGVAALLAALIPVILSTASAVDPASSDPVLFAAGDVASCDLNGDEATAAIIDAEPAAKVAMLGDGAYPMGTLEKYNACYEPTWGRFRSRTLPVPGNHDYVTDGSAAGYFGYFGPIAGDPSKGYYSYDLGPWHIIALNTNCNGVDGGKTASPPGGCSSDSVQLQWLRADLADTQAKCMIAMWHHARFFSSAEGSGKTPPPSSDGKTNHFWRILQGAGADIVLSGHHHIYERFARMGVIAPTVQGAVDPNGMRAFVVGTGGGPQQTIVGDPPVGSEVRIGNVWGVLKLSLHETTYDWAFIAADGTVQDSGSDVCRTDIAAR